MRVGWGGGAGQGGWGIAHSAESITCPTQGVPTMGDAMQTRGSHTWLLCRRRQLPRTAAPGIQCPSWTQRPPQKCDPRLTQGWTRPSAATPGTRPGKWHPHPQAPPSCSRHRTPGAHTTHTTHTKSTKSHAQQCHAWAIRHMGCMCEQGDGGVRERGCVCASKGVCVSKGVWV